MKNIMQRIQQGNFLVAFVSVLLGLLVGAFILTLAGNNPISAYRHLFEGIFGNPYLFGESIRQMTPLIFTGLAAAFAFRTGLFNIGLEGQFLVGQLAAVTVGIVFSLPMFLHIPLAMLAAIVAGGIWGVIPGYLKARRGVHEVISTIMLNWIALFLCNYLIRTYLKGRTERTEDIQPTASLSSEWLSQLFDGARVHMGIFIAILAAVFVYFFLWRTTKGFELRAVGDNIHGAEYAGMGVGRNIMLSMGISGALAGLAGASEGLGVSGYMPISAALPGYGFDGLAVALIGANTSTGVILGAILLGGMTFGGKGMQMSADVPDEIIRIIIALVIFFVASSRFVRKGIQWMIASLSRVRRDGDQDGTT